MADRIQGGFSVNMARIIVWVVIFESKRTDCRHLRDVLTGLCPVEVGPIAGQHDDAAGRIGLDLVSVETIAEADVENAGHDGVDPVLPVPVRHQLDAGWHFDPDHATTTARRTEGGNAGNGFQSMSSGRTDLKTAWPGCWVRTICNSPDLDAPPSDR
jgi:hypothetical protein